MHLGENLMRYICACYYAHPHIYWKSLPS